MRTTKNLVIVGLVVLVAVFLAAPSAFAKKKLADDELDLITAAGEPTVIEAVTGTISFSDDYTPVLDIAGTSQQNVQGLVINNVSGENQLANALNIASLQFQNGAPDQSNKIIQSWGATKDLSAVTVSATTVAGFAPTAVVSTSTSTAAAADADAPILINVNAQAQCGLAGESKCAATRQAQGAIQVGFAASAHDSASASASASASQPGISGKIDPSKIAVLSAYADLIIDEVGGDVILARQLSPTLTFGDDAQTNIAALVLNNVSGLNQVANAINIQGGGVTITPVALATSNQLFDASSQSNFIIQYRGTPVNRPDQFFK